LEGKKNVWVRSEHNQQGKWEWFMKIVAMRKV
jgi:hypothetical protein